MSHSDDETDKRHNGLDQSARRCHVNMVWDRGGCMRRGSVGVGHGCSLPRRPVGRENGAAPCSRDCKCVVCPVHMHRLNRRSIHQHYCSCHAAAALRMLNTCRVHSCTHCSGGACSMPISWYWAHDIIMKHAILCDMFLEQGRFCVCVMN